MKVEEVKKVFDGRSVGSVNGLYIKFYSDENTSEKDVYKLHIEGVKTPYEFSVTQIKTNGNSIEVTAKRENEGWKEVEIDIRSLIGLEITRVTDEGEIETIERKWREM